MYRSSLLVYPPCCLSSDPQQTSSRVSRKATNISTRASKFTIIPAQRRSQQRRNQRRLDHRLLRPTTARMKWEDCPDTSCHLEKLIWRMMRAARRISAMPPARGISSLPVARGISWLARSRGGLERPRALMFLAATSRSRG